MKLIVFTALKEELNTSILNKDIEVVYTGIGKINAAIKAFSYLTNYFAFDISIDPAREPQKDNIVVLNVGSAGSIIANDQGNIKRCSTFVQRDCLLNGYEQPKYQFDMPQFIHTCNTGDDFLTSIPKYPCDAYDMEAYAQAAVCKHLGIPYYGSIKIITDIIGSNSSETWKKSLEDWYIPTTLTNELNEFNNFLKHYSEVLKNLKDKK